MGRIIECCVRNVDNGVSDRLRESGDAVRIRPCLERCGLCRDRPFLVVDGELVIGHHLPEPKDAGRNGVLPEPSLASAPEDEE